MPPIPPQLRNDAARLADVGSGSICGLARRDRQSPDWLSNPANREIGGPGSNTHVATLPYFNRLTGEAILEKSGGQRTAGSLFHPCKLSRTSVREIFYYGHLYGFPVPFSPPSERLARYGS